MRFYTLLAMFILAVSACAADDSDGGQTGSETFGCLVVETTDLAIDEASPLGFSGQDLLSVVDGENTLGLRWSDGSESQLTLSVTYDSGAVRYQEREFRSDDGREIAMDCPDLVEVEATLAFRTHDGAFDESWPVVLSASQADQVTIHREVDPEAVTGTYEVTEVNPSEFDAVRLFVDVQYSEAAISGTVSGQAEITGDSSDPNSTASAQNFAVASWPADAEE